MPTEMLLEGKMTRAVDIYSFAMLMWELLEGRYLFQDTRQSQVGQASRDKQPGSNGWIAVLDAESVGELQQHAVNMHIYIVDAQGLGDGQGQVAASNTLSKRIK